MNLRDSAGFAEFTQAVHGHDPFPWQRDLVDEVLDTGRWPDALDVPTGLGKTSVLDAAIYTAAAAGGGGPARRRVFFVVDRRVVVDQAWEHARALAAALAKPAAPVVAAVGTALRTWAAPDPPVTEPLLVTRMRGGVTWDWRWCPRPDQPAIIVGTVDQIGSRLLFRGYGVGERLRPLDAALTGTDSLIVVDEAHLAVPFVNTVRAAVNAEATPRFVPSPIVLALSATPGVNAGRVFTIDMPAHHRHPVAGRRLSAAKTLNLVVTTGGPRDVAATMATIATRFADRGARVVGVIANTVARARTVHQRLAAHTPGSTILLTGRSRPHERDALLAAWLPRIRAGRTRTDHEPLFVVATQTLEVGADVDFDALVTDNTSWDALVQRLGRLNRAGDLDTPAPVAVVRAGKKDDPDAAPRPDPVYGHAAEATWRYLSCHVAPVVVTAKAAATVVFPPGLAVSPSAVDALRPYVPDDALAARLRTPLLLEPFLDMWAATAPTPEPDPPVSLFLHGADTPREVVSVLWRADITSADLHHPAGVAAAVALLDAVPPAAGEQIELPLPAVRAWLRGAIPDTDVTDHEALATAVGDRDDLDSRRVLRLSGPGDGAAVTAGAIRPGDVLLAPADIGGLDGFGWAPESATPVRDIGDLVERRHRRHLRLDPAVWAGSATEAVLDRLRKQLAVMHAAVKAAADDRAAAGIIRRTILALAETLGDDEIAGTSGLAQLAVEAAAPGTRLHIVGRCVLVSWGASAVGAGEDSTAIGSALAHEPVTLSVHQKAVAERARAFADALRLLEPLARAVELAAATHDEGKREPRFQAMLHAGEAILAELADEPLAKSGMDSRDRAVFRRAAQRAGFPAGARHELLSQRLVQAAIEAAAHRSGSEIGQALRGGVDPELLIHLVGSHHGWARPLHPATADPAAGPVQARVLGVGVDVEAGPAGAVDWLTPRRFAALNRRYGRWGLALLEACVRLADIACSEEGT